MQTSFLTTFLLITILPTFSALTTAQAAPPPAAIPAMAIPINFHVVTKDTLYRGARPQSAASLNYLKAIGVKTVIDLQGGDLNNFFLGPLVPFFEKGETPKQIAAERKAVEDRQMAFYNFPLNSLAAVSDQDAKRIQAIIEIMDDPKQQPVYIHCAHGADRTGLVVALYRVKVQAWTRSAAHQEMVANGHSLIHILGTHGMDEYLITEGLGQYFKNFSESLDRILDLIL